MNIDIQETSLQAYKEINYKLGQRHEIIIEALKELSILHGDATDSEIKDYLNQQDPNYVRPRRFELVNKYKKVGYSQTRMCRITGKSCMAWKVL